MDIISSVLSAFGLSTAAGLNAYIPLLVVGLLDRYTNLVNLSAPYDTISNPWVLLVIAVLALIDLVGDKIPAVDHAFHAAGIIINPVAGALLFMATTGSAGDVNPVLAAICGVLLAGVTHGARATIRPVATATTAGFANPVVSTVEDVTSFTISLLAIFVPLLAFLAVIGSAVAVFLIVRRVRPRREARAR
ncbi:MAG: hypothetical protein RLZZ387_4560 [Chloroflexota bacterium]|jgi:hypothetical protein